MDKDNQNMVMKNGAFIELGAYILAIISDFLPFSQYKFKYVSAMKIKYIEATGGVLLLIFMIIAIIVVTYTTFSKISENKDKQQDKKVGREYLDYIPLIVAVLSFLMAIFYGMFFGGCAIGFYLLIFSLIVAICLRGYILYVKRELTKSNENQTQQNNQQNNQQTQQNNQQNNQQTQKNNQQNNQQTQQNNQQNNQANSNIPIEQNNQGEHKIQIEQNIPTEQNGNTKQNIPPEQDIVNSSQLV